MVRTTVGPDVERRAAAGTPPPGQSRLQFLPGIGPARALAFERLGIVTVEDLLRHFPRTYLDARRSVRIADLRAGELVTVSGTVKSAAAVRTRGGRTDFMAAIEDGSGTLGCYFFGQGFLARTLRAGARVVVSGELEPLQRRMLNPLFEVVEDDVRELVDVGRLVPIHALTRGLTARAMRRAVRGALDRAAERLQDPVPADVVERCALVPLGRALREIHFPESDASYAAARRRLAFEELFLLQAVMELRRKALAETGRGLAITASGALAARARQALPFTLTDDQARAPDEIVADLRRPFPMQRLLLGDVGSGKTAVAFLAAAHAVEAGHQAAFMAPTEILARQHAATLARFGAPAGIEVVCLTGSTTKEERRRAQARLAAGEPLLVVGTHALLVEDVEMPGLGFAIVDEQHRFGVRQRASLAKKGVVPDVLVLTATPIPRTLMLACYGDLDVSRLAARPAGRGRLVTRVAGEERFPQVIEFMAKELAAGRQAFVVLPAIEEGAASGHRAAEAEHRRLSSHPVLAGFRVGLLHGRQKSEAKRESMDAFARGEVHVLVTTTVVEVGVDVPNATLMVVESAERFGLSQLHQLRGRVGRGAHRSVCVLVPSPGAPSQAQERLAVLASTTDGFEIAEADLRLRGPGELWGTRQSGLPRLKLADLARDEGLLEEAREAARRVLADDPWLMRREHAALRETLLARYREPIELALAG